MMAGLIFSVHSGGKSARTQIPTGHQSINKSIKTQCIAPYVTNESKAMLSYAGDSYAACGSVDSRYGDSIYVCGKVVLQTNSKSR